MSAGASDPAESGEEMLLTPVELDSLSHSLLGFCISQVVAGFLNKLNSTNQHNRGHYNITNPNFMHYWVETLKSAILICIKFDFPPKWVPFTWICLRCLETVPKILFQMVVER